MKENRPLHLHIAEGFIITGIAGGAIFLFIKFILIPFFTVAGISIIVSLIIFYLFDPLLTFMERKGIEREKGTKGIFLAGILCLGILAGITAPKAVKRGKALFSEEGFITETINRGLKKVMGPFEGYLPESFSYEKISQKLDEMQKDFFESLPAILNQITYMLILVPFITYFLLKEKRTILNRILDFVPNRYFEITLHLIHRINYQWGLYIRGKLLESLILTVVIILFLLPLRPPHLFLQSFIAGIMNIIPYIGSIIGAVPGIIIAINTFEPPLIIYVLFVYFIVAQVIVDEIILTPTLLAKVSDLHPVTVIIALFIGEEVGGIMGMLLAVPLTIFFKIIFFEIYHFFKYKGETPP